MSDPAADLQTSGPGAATIGNVPYRQLTRPGRPARFPELVEAGETALAYSETSALLAGDPVSDFLALDRATLERAIDHFLDQFDSLAGELGRLETSTGLLSVVTLAGMTAVASQVVIRGRRLRDAERGGAPSYHNEEGSGGLPRVPNSWSWGLAET
jgi:hypothetical protein